ncbi:ATP-binding protein, partial [Actinoallomurus liliacearum]|uniref:ATP-binding protein n=1 Tax=Actinoallomurus liliacearum TaxID=1080073 RepID=UPI0031F0BB46
TPAQLPPDIPDFTGRAGTVEQLHQYLTTRQGNGTTARTIAICGMTGVGKTALALHVAHLHQSAFPDGQIYADLHGASCDPADPADVLADFLRAVGISDQHIPAALTERTKLFRTWCNRRRVLIILDDVRSASQIKALLPATPRCAVIITSQWTQHTIPGLHGVELGPMDPCESLQFLTHMIGRPRVAAEEDQAYKITDLCGHLPLAIRAMGARLVTARTWSLKKMADLIETSLNPLDHFQYAELDLRAGYDAGYNCLTPQQRSTFRLLSLLPPDDFTAQTTAGLVGIPPDAAEAQLIQLATCHLLETGAEGQQTTYRLHALTRHYARERLNKEFIKPQTIGTGPAVPVGAGRLIPTSG